MSINKKFALSVLIALTSVFASLAGQGYNESARDEGVLQAQVVATGIPGAGAIAQIGTFQKGGPLRDNAALINHSTDPDHVLDRTRVLVASTSNFGAPLVSGGGAPGSILSLNVNGATSFAVPPDFATAGGQATAADGKVILYTAQSAAFRNSVNNPLLSDLGGTKELPSVSLPRGISFNNGFGRPWFANAPGGVADEGTISVVDPNGAPLANAPSTLAGGVFSGTTTNREASAHGLAAAALATALITKSPDGTGRAVFLAALADGSVSQVHVQKNVSDLLPAGSFTPISGIGTDAAESNNANSVTRVGMLFNWVPTRTVFISDPLENRILVFDLVDDGTLFHADNVHYIDSPRFDLPIDIAPAVPEVAERNFASNTTLGAGSDLYVLNRGNNSIVRLTQRGEVVAIRQIQSGVAEFRVNGIAVSEDARTIWVTATAPGRQGVALRLPTFGAGAVTTSMIDHAISEHVSGAILQGREMFSQELAPDKGFGPLFNGRSCNSCHNTPVTGGMGSDDDSFVARVARINKHIFDALLSHGGPIARQRSISELGFPCGMPTGVPPQANAVSIRSAMTLRGTSLIDNILQPDIVANMNAEPESVRGHMNLLADGRAGRFGWKAQTATLVEFMGEAFRDEMGVTNPIASRDLVNGCGASIARPEADSAPLTHVAAFLNTIDPPVPDTGAACLASAGAQAFANVGCAACHRPSFTVPGSGLTIRLYSDLLLHDMGEGLADGFVQGSATGSQFRTAPLWRAADRVRFLHDGRALTIGEAIAAHGGQASVSREAFFHLSPTEQQSVLDFVGCI